MSTIEQIGRLTEDIEFHRVTVGRQGRLQVDGKLHTGDYDRAVNAKHLLTSHLGNEFEPIIPFVSTKYPRWSGYYQLAAADVTLNKGAFELGRFPLSFELIPVTGHRTPLIECILAGGPRAGRSANDLSWWAVPSTARAVDPGHTSTTDQPNMTTHTGPGGSVLFFGDDSAANAAASYFYNAQPSFMLAPENWYDMAATLYVEDLPVVGRQIANEPTSWLADNGLLRVGPGDGSLLAMTLPAGASATEWGDTVQIDVGYRLPDTTWAAIEEAVAITAVRVRNEEISIALRCETFRGGATNPQAMTVYVSMRRGSRYFTVTTASAGTTLRPAVWINGGPSSTSLGGSGTAELGFYTAANGDGLRTVFASSEAGGNTAVDEANSRVSKSTESPQLEVGIGFSWDDVITHGTAATQAARWFAGVGETQFVRRGGYQ